MKKILNIVFILIVFLTILCGCGTLETQNKTYSNTKEFNKIVLDEIESDIKIKYSQDNTFSYSYLENDEYYKVEIKDDSSKLTIKRIDTRTSFNRGNKFSENSIDVLSIPKNYNGEIEVNLSYGNINIDDIKGENIAVSLNLESGDISINKTNISSLNLKLTSGNIIIDNFIAKTININKTNAKLSLKNLKNNDSLLIKSDNGLVELDSIESLSIGIESENGDSILKNIDVKQSLNVKINTGKINLNLNGKKTDYSLKASTKVGSAPESTSLGDINIVLYTNVGEIKVSYLK